MIRKTLALTLAVSLVAASGTVAAQAPRGATPATPAAPAQGNARGRLVAPVRGVALIGHTRPVTVRKGNNYVTTIRIKNLSTGAVAGFRAEEFWYDRAGQPVSGSNTYRPRQPLQPGQVADITLTSPANPNSDRNALQFNHANGDVKMQLMARIEAPTAPAAQ
jgi:hypothetical protein